MTDLIQALTDAGASIATIIVLAYLLIQQNKMIKGFQESVDKNTSSTDGLMKAIEKLEGTVGGCSYNAKNLDLLKKN